MQSIEKKYIRYPEILKKSHKKSSLTYWKLENKDVGFIFFYAKKIKEFAKHSPYISLVGPITNVNWSDSLLASMTFYHNTIHKPIGPRLAGQKMNLAANLDNIFQIDLAENMYFSK